MMVISAAAAVTVPKKVTKKHPNPLLKSKESKLELTRRNKKIWNWTNYLQVKTNILVDRKSVV